MIFTLTELQITSEFYTNYKWILHKIQANFTQITNEFYSNYSEFYSNYSEFYSNYSEFYSN